MCLNAGKTKKMFISPQDDIQPEAALKLSDNDIENVTSFTLLGVLLENHLKFDSHVQNIIPKARMKTHDLVTLKRYGTKHKGPHTAVHIKHQTSTLLRSPCLV